MGEKNKAKKALERLATCETSKALLSAFLEGGGLDGVNEEDFFNVTRLKKVKDGFEVEFFDRLKALEALRKIEKEEEGGNYAQLLCQAISKGAEAVSDKKQSE
ncbi:MAG: hypothetical protein LBC56_08495 [Oscillospiraceae bacterium]|nr:hypothetical protein [Oscillospiraceae bacterium]